MKKLVTLVIALCTIASHVTASSGKVSMKIDSPASQAVRSIEPTVGGTTVRLSEKELQALLAKFGKAKPAAEQTKPTSKQQEPETLFQKLMKYPTLPTMQWRGDLATEAVSKEKGIKLSKNVN